MKELSQWDFASKDLQGFASPVQAVHGTMTSGIIAAQGVTGIAALLLSVNATLSAEELKNIIISAVRPLPSLTGNVSSGGLVDAYKALTLVKDGIK